MKNYKLIESKFIDQIASKVNVYEHEKTHAKVMCIENDDKNKVFNIAFRTPAINSCGLTHILEHSVLCGSKKYPVKDPFVELMKASLNTFLNAMTFPDKTMYPCASCNLADFKNLMSVYMDAVFYPNIYKYEEIFLQEGWHYDIHSKDEPIKYNGVVYNEMKGAFSDPNQILGRQIIHSLFPDNCYQFESGGDPKFIPDLSYEEFKNFHSKYYHPSNSYIFLYGDVDFEERLDWIDREYLSKYDPIDFDTTIKHQDSFEKPIFIKEKYPVALGSDLKGKTFLSYNVVLPSTLDQKMLIAMAALNKVLFENPGAPIKQALLNAGICTDVETSIMDDLAQPILSIDVVGSDIEKEQQFIDLINEELKKQINGGLNKDAIRSFLNFAEFKTRENRFSPYTPQGLVYQIQAMSTWLYDDKAAFTALETLDLFKELKEGLDGNYFEELLSNLLLNNNHKTYVSLIPSDSFFAEQEKETAEKLAKYKQSLSEKELDELLAKNEDLLKYQQEDSTPEEIATLPQLKQEDLKADLEKYNFEVLEGKYKTLFSDYQTNNIAYLYFHFKLRELSSFDVKEIKLFTTLLTQISTKDHHYSEIVNSILNLTGGLGISLVPFTTKEKETGLLIDAGFSAIKENIKPAIGLLKEVLFESNFDDLNRLKEKLLELKTRVEMDISGRGHSVAFVRAAAQLNPHFRINEATDGVEWLDYINDLVANFDEKAPKLIEDLKLIVSKFISKENCYVGFTGSKELLDLSKEDIDSFFECLPEKTNYEECKELATKQSEALIAPYDVNFNAMVGTFDEKYTGALLVLANAINVDFLWKNVRVLGGAYGCFMIQNRNGIIGLTSYRDPNVQKTLDTYLNIVEFVKNLPLDDSTLLKYKIGALGGTEAVVHVSSKGSASQMSYFTHITQEDNIQLRQELIDTTKEDIHKLSTLFEQFINSKTVVSLGKEETINKATFQYDTRRNLVK